MENQTVHQASCSLFKAVFRSHSPFAHPCTKETPLWFHYAGSYWLSLCPSTDTQNKQGRLETVILPWAFSSLIPFLATTGRALLSRSFT